MLDMSDKNKFVAVISKNPTSHLNENSVSRLHRCDYEPVFRFDSDSRIKELTGRRVDDKGATSTRSLPVRPVYMIFRLIDALYQLHLALFKVKHSNKFDRDSLSTVSWSPTSRHPPSSRTTTSSSG